MLGIRKLKHLLFYIALCLVYFVCFAPSKTTTDNNSRNSKTSNHLSLSSSKYNNVVVVGMSFVVQITKSNSNYFPISDIRDSERQWPTYHESSLLQVSYDYQKI